jgi:radical SAM protein with 4Fe4S-binding SPASM domain
VERDQKVMTLEEIENYLTQAKPYAERVCFHVMGEPLNHPQFPQAIELAQKHAVPIEITTNGTLLTAVLIEALLSPAVVQVNFSLQSFVDNFPKANPETYFEKILQFCSLAQDKRPDLFINFRFWNLNPGEKQNQINEFFLKKIEEFFHAKLNRNVDPSFKKSKNISGRIYAHFDSRFEWPTVKNPIVSTSGTCWGARSQIAIHASGKVVPCCLDKEADVLLGDVKTQSFEQILTGSVYTEIKDGFEKNKLVADLCQRCTFRQRFQSDTSITV